jgi:hypothetical protein
MVLTNPGLTVVLAVLGVALVVVAVLSLYRPGRRKALPQRSRRIG